MAEKLTCKVLKYSDNALITGVNEGIALCIRSNCGKEPSPEDIKASGIKVVIVDSVSHIFYRNSINTGITIIESSDAVIKIYNEDVLKIDTANGSIHNITRN